MKKKIGVLKEVYSSWERRAPLAPKHVNRLICMGHEVLVEKSQRRIFSDADYERAGARVVESTRDFNDAEVILGVKQPKNGSLLKAKTYCFFSHTIKAQEENMALLDECLRQEVTLVDYECIVDEEGKRIVKFGEFAGRAGMIDTLRGYGQAMLLNNAINTPFLTLGSTYMYPTYEDAIDDIKRVGKVFRKGFSGENPIVAAFTGTGCVARGAKETFSFLNPYETTLKELENADEDEILKQNAFIQINLQLGDIFRPRDHSKMFSREEYNEFPQRFEKNLHNQRFIRKHCNILVNSNYWDHRFPRTITAKTIDDFDNLEIIGDLSCDIEGGIGILKKTTSIEEPFYYHPKANGIGKLYILGVDILPSELPIEASNYFGDQLVQYLPKLFENETTENKAVICSQGKISPDYKYIMKLRKLKREDSLPPVDGVSRKYSLRGHLFDTRIINKVLDGVEDLDGQAIILDCIVKPPKETEAVVEVNFKCADESRFEVLETFLNDISESGLNYEIINDNDPSDKLPSVQFYPTKKVINLFGSGLMSAPVIEYLTRDSISQGRYDLRVISNSTNELETIKQRFSERKDSLSLVSLDIADTKKLNELISAVDTVVNISLLPSFLHGPIINASAEFRKPLVTASYVPDGLENIERKLVNDKNMFLFEMGLDPGMDHMSAMKMIQEVQDIPGARITKFSSVCGGLYDKKTDVLDNFLNYKFSWSPKGVLLASKNSSKYLLDGKVIQTEKDKLLEHVQEYNLVDYDKQDFEVLPNRDSMKYKSIYGLNKEENLHTLFRGTLRYKPFVTRMNDLSKLGLLSESKTIEDILSELVPSGYSNFIQDLVNKTGSKEKVAIDALCEYLSSEPDYQLDNEFDAIFMEHRLEYIDESSTKREKVGQLILTGNEEYSAMAKTVGLTTAIGAHHVFKEHVLKQDTRKTGIIVPIHRSIYTPVLLELQKEGIKFKFTDRTM
eukprot:snap_masked-scaffold_10-processed-gene-2.16-mRNA-1 protein AED:0.05 eAED:0.08 QI:0/-1/0/1/-1/1/1/0/959